jgi:CYTH domain-containing protein
MEIERKFVLAGPPPSELLGAGVEIAQGYLPERLRIRRKGERCYITLKSEGGLAREEWETELPAWAFAQLWPHTDGRRLEKRRYALAHAGRTLEVDRYGGRLEGLWTLECEAACVEEARAFTLPAWASGAREVTEDPRYRNAVLAERGLPDEQPQPGDH